jgi:hypothetical protein
MQLTVVFLSAKTFKSANYTATRMKIFIFAFLLALAVAVHAAPSGNKIDDLIKYLNKIIAVNLTYIGLFFTGVLFKLVQMNIVMVQILVEEAFLLSCNEIKI